MFILTYFNNYVIYAYFTCIPRSSRTNYNFQFLAPLEQGYYWPLFSPPLWTNFSKNIRTEGRRKKRPTNVEPTKKRAKFYYSKMSLNQWKYWSMNVKLNKFYLLIVSTTKVLNWPIFWCFILNFRKFLGPETLILT